MKMKKIENLYFNKLANFPYLMIFLKIYVKYYELFDILFRIFIMFFWLILFFEYSNISNIVYLEDRIIDPYEKFLINNYNCFEWDEDMGTYSNGYENIPHRLLKSEVSDVGNITAERAAYHCETANTSPLIPSLSLNELVKEKKTSPQISIEIPSSHPLTPPEGYWYNITCKQINDITILFQNSDLSLSQKQQKVYEILVSNSLYFDIKNNKELKNNVFSLLNNIIIENIKSDELILKQVTDNCFYILTILSLDIPEPAIINLVNSPNFQHVLAYIKKGYG
jgi:hypothetical protein